VHYYYVTREQFLEDVSQGRFLEWAEVHGNLYGTSVSEIDRIRRMRKARRGPDACVCVRARAAHSPRRSPSSRSMCKAP
jgi:guanylate kinase